ncbi:MAG TPA: acyltransferase domain-containing protein [Clostridiales bacterium]|nr:acyltransferase domain-containing protein [Clostridiales bacterium]
MRNYVSMFCDEFKYPAEAKECFLDAFDKVSACEETAGEFMGLVEAYDLGDDLLDKLTNLAEKCGVHKFTLHLLYFICLSKRLRELYEENNLPYEIYYDTVSDLKWKLMECHHVEGVWGSFVANWFRRFYRLDRFALGRLQFEPSEIDFDYKKGDKELKKGDLVINIHIPSAGPLHKELCLDAYKRAAEFYKDRFNGKPIAFVCYSWLLYPRHTEFLPENSNILKFMEDFDIVWSKEQPHFGDCWRIFGKAYNGDPDDLPQETSLQRAYASWLKKGNTVANGYGVFFYDDLPLNK